MKTSPTKRSFQAALALTLLACSGLSGCSDSQEQNASNTASAKTAVATARAKTPNGTPKANSTATGTPTAAASPTATLSPELEVARKQARDTQPPPKPELITVNSDDGAIATAKYWVQLYYYIYTTGKVDEYKELCSANKSGASKPVENATEDYSKGNWIDPVIPKFTAAFRRGDITDRIVIQVNYEREPFNEYSSTGETKYHQKQSRWAAVELEYNGSQWLVKGAFTHED
ncbi:hypothetical protein CJ186_08335 [Actinomyces graevenitzii]|uniref:DUF6318 domain-containing protein n=1 Tax=Actinomyces graevenitzii C83 TaxID=435830 RepID=G9PD83_9ACTO|nr:DUF6318 family protein [Actinomyces graevenitzii]EHM89697.1 hypothetical protein HMPREF0045_00362 [Actinomyces graevenitzii C83]PMC91020.1 hypothetical protein CJ186_08335 [Actinomyces graevenitzii]